MSLAARALCCALHAAHVFKMRVPDLLRCQPSHGPMQSLREHKRCLVQLAWMSVRVQWPEPAIAMAAASLAARALRCAVHAAHVFSMRVPDLLRCQPSHGPMQLLREHLRCLVQLAWMSVRVQWPEPAVAMGTESVWLMQCLV